MRHVVGAALVFLGMGEAYGACEFDPDQVKVQWTGYKTAKKIGVDGLLPKVTLNAKKAGDVKAALKTVSFTIDPSKVDSKNPVRDEKIAKFFFGNTLNNGLMTGAVTKLDEEYAYVDLVWNGVKKTIPMQLEVKDQSVIGQGVIDMLDFSASKAWQAIHKACLELHEGKTWSEAAVKVELHCKKS